MTYRRPWLSSAMLLTLGCGGGSTDAPVVQVTPGGGSGGVSGASAGAASAHAGTGGAAGHSSGGAAGKASGGAAGKSSGGSGGSAGGGSAGKPPSAGGHAGSADAGSGGVSSGGAAGQAGTSGGAGGSSSPPVCGNGVVEMGELCDDTSAGCVNCQSPCTKEGGHTCGGNGIPGNPNVVYVCSGGIQVPEKDCGVPCQQEPAGVPDQCPQPPSSCDAPQGLIDALSPKPYVEDNCSPTTWNGWPYEAFSCSYSSGGLSATVTVADPPADKVACWISDAGTLIPALDGLRTTDPAAWEQGLTKIALTTVLYQSSRIFPLEGGIIEDQGSGYIDYSFLKGVTTTCSTGCYCRINSLHRTEWCTYVAGTGGNYDDCINKVGSSGLTEGWGDECLQNHIDAWKSDKNEHFRAKAFVINQNVAKTCPAAGSCTGAQVVQAIADSL